MVEMPEDHSMNYMRQWRILKTVNYVLLMHEKLKNMTDVVKESLSKAQKR